jgi:hypothetical protein
MSIFFPFIDDFNKLIITIVLIKSHNNQGYDDNYKQHHN